MGKRQRSIISHAVSGGADNKITAHRLRDILPITGATGTRLFLCEESLGEGVASGPMTAVLYYFFLQTAALVSR